MPAALPYGRGSLSEMDVLKALNDGELIALAVVLVILVILGIWAVTWVRRGERATSKRFPRLKRKLPRIADSWSRALSQEEFDRLRKRSEQSP